MSLGDMCSSKGYCAISNGGSSECSVNVAELYKNFCAEEGCKANSAFLRYIIERGSRYSLEHIVLDNNYLGPKGLRPVIRLIDYCQSLTTISLQGNGADNSTVEGLCGVLRKHLSVSSVNLRNNPISGCGGKLLLELLESNHNIVHLDVSDTDIFESLQERIRSLVNVNRTHHSRTNPRLVAANPVAFLRATPPLTSKRTTKKAPILEAMTCATNTSADAIGRPTAVSAAKGALPNLKSKHTHVPQSSRQTTRLSATQLSCLRAKFAERARIASEFNQSEATRTADLVRAELMALECNAQPNTRQDSNYVSLPALIPQPACVLSTVSTEGTTNGEGSGDAPADERAPPPTTHAAETSTPLDDDVGSTDASVKSLSAVFSELNVMPSAYEVPSQSIVEGRHGKDAETAGDGQLVVLNREGTVEPDRLMGLSSEEQFQHLFEQGCRAYSRNDLDAAYMDWSTAMNIAVSKKNREWMAVVFSNLQRLSYELLVKEGATHLENGDLTEADRAYRLALEVAAKARNAAWEADMLKARKKVQNAVFYRYHESALVFFERAQQLPRQRVTEDDRFLLPGTDTMMQHTEAFVNEWSHMLLVKEAVEMWVEASRVVKCIGRTASSDFRDTVDEALHTVACYLVKRLYDVEEPDSLSWQRTCQYTYHECIMLSELWADMVANVYQNLQHTTLTAIASTQLGHLYLASNQLQLAQHQFDNVTQYGRELSDPLIEAMGLSFSAMLHYQCANYGDAERQLTAAIERLEKLRSVQGTRNSSSEICNRSENKQPLCGSVLMHSIPDGFIAVLLNASRRSLVSIMASTYRYREALKTLEYALSHQYADVLTNKMHMNFPARPTIEQISAIAEQISSPLVYHVLMKRYEWCDSTHCFEVEEHVLIWVVPQKGELRFVEMNVRKNFNTSVTELLRTARCGMQVDPLSVVGVEEHIITTLHRNSWMEPLRMLYAVLMDPIMEFVCMLDPQFQDTYGVITFIPSGALRLVPFNALMSRDDAFLVEKVALQFGFCATQVAFSSLSAVRVRQRNLYRDSVVVQPEMDLPTQDFTPVYPFDPDRSVAEGEIILSLFSDPKCRPTARFSTTQSTSKTYEGLVDGVESFRNTLPRARTLHVAAAAIATQDNDDGSAGAFCLSIAPTQLGFVRASDIAHMDLFADVITMSNANVASERVTGTREGTACLLRSFFSAGVPCVIAGQWCTPDMKPVDLFIHFYTYYVKARAEAKEHPVSPYTPGGMAAQAAGSLTTKTMDPHSADDHLYLQRHKAVILAKAIRALLAEGTMRYNPRAWAGFNCFGYGYF